MAKLTWLGEDDADGPGKPGPSFIVWNGIKFPVREAVEVSDTDMIRRAKGNKFFTVENGEPRRGRPPKVKDGDQDQG